MNSIIITICILFTSLLLNAQSAEPDSLIAEFQLLSHLNKKVAVTDYKYSLIEGNNDIIEIIITRSVFLEGEYKHPTKTVLLVEIFPGETSVEIPYQGKSRIYRYDYKFAVDQGCYEIGSKDLIEETIKVHYINDGVWQIFSNYDAFDIDNTIDLSEPSSKSFQRKVPVEPEEFTSPTSN